MLSELFYWTVNLSVGGGLTGLAVLALRRIRRLPRPAVYWLWLAPVIRLWIPLGVASRYSLMNLVSAFFTRTVVALRPIPGLPELTMTNSLMAAEHYFPVVYKTDLLAGVFRAASVIWAAVAAAGLLTACLLYARTKARLKHAVRLRDNVYMSDAVPGPAVYGVFRPRIVIPGALALEDIEYILRHEQAHIRRWDNLLRLLAVLTACVHWFNPLVWVFLPRFFADMELACDASVLKRLTPAQAKDYARSVLAGAQHRPVLSSAFGGAKTRDRIENILSYKKLTVLSALSSLALVIAAAVVLTTNAAV